MKILGLSSHPILHVRTSQQMKNAKAAKRIMLAVSMHKVTNKAMLEELLDSLIEDPLTLETYKIRPKGSHKRAQVLSRISSIVSNLLKGTYTEREIEYLAFGIEAFSWTGDEEC